MESDEFRCVRERIEPTSAVNRGQYYVEEKSELGRAELPRIPARDASDVEVGLCAVCTAQR